MAAVVIVGPFLSLGLLTPSIRSAIVIWQSTGYVQLKNTCIDFLKYLFKFLPVGVACGG